MQDTPSLLNSINHQINFNEFATIKCTKRKGGKPIIL